MPAGASNSMLSPTRIESPGARTNADGNSIPGVWAVLLLAPDVNHEHPPQLPAQHKPLRAGSSQVVDVAD